MKKIALLTVLGVLLTLVSCKKDDTTSTPTTCKFENASLVGNWKFSNVKDSLGNDILSKVDNCMDENIFTFTKDSFKSSQCDESNVNKFYTATTVNGINELRSNGYTIIISSYDCKSLTFKQSINRSGLFVGTAYYTMVKQ